MRLLLLSVLGRCVNVSATIGLDPTSVGQLGDGLIGVSIFETPLAEILETFMRLA